MFRRLSRTVATTASVAVLGLFAIPEVAHAANVEITITDADGTAIPRAMVAVLNSDGDSVDSGIADSTGKVTLNDDNAASYVVAAPGFGSKIISEKPVASATVKLTASTKSKLSYSNAFGGQVQKLAGDAESGVFYATSDAKPSVWRTTDYAGSWSPVPTAAEDTTASGNTAGALPSSVSGGEVFTSAAKGEVAVMSNNSLYFSRDYGTTWTSISNYGQVNGTNKSHSWVHGGANGEYSMIFARTDSDLYAAVIPDSKSDSALPSFASVKTNSGFSSAYSAGDTVAFAVGTTGDMYMISVGASSTKISQIALGGPGAPDISASSTATVAGHSMAASGPLRLSTLGGATPKAFISQSTTAFAVGYYDGSTWNVSSGLEVSTKSDQMETLTSKTVLEPASGPSQAICGYNGGALASSIVNDAPAAGEILEGFEVVGTIGQCQFVFNSTGAGSLGSVSVTADKVGLLPMGGANNNTGFAWDSGFNFSDNLVAISGDGQFGLRKSANLAVSTQYRPQFGQAGGTSATNYIDFQATSGKETSSGGIAVNGMTAPNVTDIAYDPNSTDGSRMVLSMTGSGGSRTLLSTDGGTSFSTIGAGGSYAVEWWNGAGDNQYIAAGFTNSPNEFLHVKGFTTATGTGKTQMGEELAATAAERDAKVLSARKSFVFEGAANPSGSSLTPTSFVSAGAKAPLLVAIEGIAGKDMMLVAVNKCTTDTGPTGCESSAGSVALVGVATNTSTGVTTLSNVKYFGSSAAENGASSVSGDGTYAGAVKAVQYCPTGSAAKVADTAFISVAGKGLYKISAVSTSPAHAATGTTSGTYGDMKIDCDTGVIAVAGADGPYLSIDGGAKFFQLKTSATQGGQAQAPTAIAVQADATSGDVTVAVASGSGDVKSIETTFTDMGLKGSDVAAGTATSPSAAVTPKADQINEVNSSANGRETGSIPDMELPPTANDKVDVASVRVFTVRAFATGMKLSVGAGGGAFKATVKNGQVTAPSTGGTPAAGTPAAGTPAAGTPTAGTPTAAAPKVATVGVKKTATVLAQLKTLGVTVVARSKIVATTSTKTVCSVLSGTRVKGLKAGICRLTVKITPPPTKKVPKPKTTTKRITVTIK